MNNSQTEQKCCNRGSNGYVFIIVLYILLAIIIGTVIY